MAIGTGAAILGGAALGALGGSKKSGSVSSTQTSAPWGMQQAYLMDSFQKANAAANNPYRGQMLSSAGTGQLGDTIRGQYLDPSSNPFLGRYVNDALGQVKSQFAGQYGGQAGSNLGNSGYQEMLARTLANTALPIYANAYGQERQNQLQAAGLASEVDRANMTNPFAPLAAYHQIVGGNYGGTATTNQPYFTNPIGGALGGALAGGQLAGLFGG
jgi:hypothetical protein